jgi:hypothetical protein
MIVIMSLSTSPAHATMPMASSRVAVAGVRLNAAWWRPSWSSQLAD